MRFLSVVASVIFACTSAWGAGPSSHGHKGLSHLASKAGSVDHLTRYSPASGHARTERRASQPQASLRVAKFSRGDTPQSSSSTNHVSSRKKSSKKKKAAHRQPSQMTPTPDRISDIQSALARGGYYKGDSSGKLDPDTVDALQRFQSSNGLDTTGKLDALTLQKLGLGSDIAGVSSPKGIVPHSCCSMSPSPSLAPPQSAVPSTPSSSVTSAGPDPASATSSH
jgi:Putative peptidoglycan binding domain